MAYRQLCTLAFVMLGLVAGCGGNTASSAGGPGPNDSAPPSADDPPPSSSDQGPPSSDDTPPSNPDTPPGNADSPGGGGRIQQLCEDACQVLDALQRCPGNMNDPMGQEVCDNGGCAAAVDPSEPIPCLDQIEGLFGCISRLPDLCMPTQEQVEPCQDEFESFSTCSDQQNPDPNPNPNPDPVENCTPAGGCNACPSPTTCNECLCDNAELGPAGAVEVCMVECTATAN